MDIWFSATFRRRGAPATSNQKIEFVLDVAPGARRGPVWSRAIGQSKRLIMERNKWSIYMVHLTEITEVPSRDPGDAQS